MGDPFGEHDPSGPWGEEGDPFADEHHHGEKLGMSTGALRWGAACARGVPEVPQLTLGTS